jgi:hypothetical protein
VTPERRGPRRVAPVLDALWRAVAYCLRLRVIALSLLPLVLMVGITFASAFFFWEPALDLVHDLLESWELLAVANDWLNQVGLSRLKIVLVPLIVLCLATPVAVVLCLLAVSAFMTSAMLKLVAARRFPRLEKRHGGSVAASWLGSAGATVLAVLLLLVSMPLWFVPPLMLVLPPLIWGWLTYRVMTYDVLADHASADERRELLRRHRPTLLAMGVVTGYLGAGPSLVWATFGAVFIVAAPLLVPLAIWIYTLVFAFSSLWFAHFALAALSAMRDEAGFPPGLAEGVPRVAGRSAYPLLPPL